MAVVQISKIQVRRGQKNSNSGVPQLSSAEFAWAVDSQELFIGNGSVAEGAPYVGNTKILTEHDNILELASSYQFASDDPSITLSVPRTLQAKADEYVSVSDFGAVGDGSTDCSDAFENAFQQLFQNVNENFRKTLMIPNGEYLFTRSISMPSKTILKGETRNGAILNFGSNDLVLETTDGTTLAGFNSSNRPVNIEISDLTISRTTGSWNVTGIANSLFHNVLFKGDYVLGSSITVSTEPGAIYWNNTLEGIKVNDLEFRNCEFLSNGIGVKCVQTIVSDTSIYFNHCKVENCDTGIYIDGVSAQGNNWLIYDCEFEEIARQAFHSTNGYGTKIARSKFLNVGNGTGDASNPEDYMVYFGESRGNIVFDSNSDRQQAAGITTSLSTVAIEEVYNSSKTSFVDNNYVSVDKSDSFRAFSIFSAFNKYMIINYHLSLGLYSRVGELHISVGNLQDDSTSQDISITDNFTYSTPFLSGTAGDALTNFEFNASMANNDPSLPSFSADTIILSYRNPISTGDTGTLIFDVTYGV